MSVQRKVAAVVAAVILLAAGAAAFWWYYLRPANAAAMLALLPEGDAPAFYVDVAALRRTGVLGLLIGKDDKEEPAYKSFIDATGFDYRRDLDAALLCLRRSETLMIIRGHFDLKRLGQYAVAHGGRCIGELCTMQGSTPLRQVSWIPLKRGLLGIAVSPDRLAATLLVGNSSRPLFAPPSSFVWLRMPGSELHATPNMPPGLSALLSDLEGARSAMFTAVPATSGLEIRIEAPCPSPQKATEIGARLSSSTDLLNKLLARENRKPDPGDLSGVLARGVFHSIADKVEGHWPVDKALLDALTH